MTTYLLRKSLNPQKNGNISNKITGISAIE